MAENSLVKPSQVQTSGPLATRSSEAIRQFLVEAGEVYGRQITSALVGIWKRELGYIEEKGLREAFSKTLKECRFFPTPADVLDRMELKYKFPNLRDHLDGLCYSGPKQIDYPKPKPMTAEELKEHNAEMVAFRAKIGPARKPLMSKEELRQAEQKLGERETSPEVLQRIEQQKKELRSKGMLS